MTRLKRALLSIAIVSGAVIAYVVTALVTTILTDSPVAGNAVAAIVAASAYWLLRKADWPLPGTVEVASGAFWGLAGAALVSCWLLAQVGVVWLSGHVSSPGFERNQQVLASTPLWLLVITAVILTPIGEEALLRGVIYSRLRKHLPFWAAVMISSLLFALVHGNLFQIVATVPLGILLAVLVEASGRLALAVSGHVVFNLSALIVPAAVIKPAANIAVVLALVVITALLLLALGMRTKAARRVNLDAITA